MTEQAPPTIYQAHPVTGEYIGQSIADVDPLDSENWLIPGMAFIDEPPKPRKGFAIVHVSESESTWSLTEDFRGTVYRTDSGQAVEWQGLGPLGDGLTQEPRPSAYHNWVNGTWKLDTSAEINALKLQAENKRDGLLQQATLRIAPLQDAVDLDEATAAEAALLKKWKQYRVAVNRVPDQTDYPKNINWPVEPS